MKLSNKSKIIIFVLSCIILITIALSMNLTSLNDFFESNNTTEQKKGIILTTEEVYLEVGDSFDAKSYIRSAFNEKGKNLINDIVINEMIDTSMPSEYEVDYILKENGAVMSKKTLKVYVIKEN